MIVWKDCVLSELGTIIGGATPSTKDSSNYENGTIPWITPKDLSDYTERFISRGERNITEKGLKSCSAQIMPKNSVLFTSRAPIGYVAIAANEVCTNQGFKSIVPNENTDFMFLYYLLKFNKDNIENLGSGTTFKEVSGNTMKNVKVRIPEDKTVQKKIAALLSSIDDKIELNKRINDNLEQQAQTIYDNICKNVEEKKIEEIISVVETGSRPKGGAETSGVPSIGAEKIEALGKYDYSNEKYISLDFFSNMKRGIVLSKDVLLYKDGAYTGKSSMALNGFPHEKCAVNEHVFILRTKNNEAQFFLYNTLKNPDIHKCIYNLACGKAAQPGLNQQELLSVTIPLPKLDSILSFEQTVRPLMEKIAENAKENLNLSKLRDSLLPKLMSGELDVDSVQL